MDLVQAIFGIMAKLCMKMDGIVWDKSNKLFWDQKTKILYSGRDFAFTKINCTIQFNSITDDRCTIKFRILV